MREHQIDFIKGCAIIAMVIGHSSPPVLLGKFIYLWHMAVFFMASGYFFKVEKVSNVGGVRDFIVKRFVKLWFVYVFWSILLILCHNMFITLNIYTDNPEFFKYVNGGYNNLTPYWHTARQFMGSMFKTFFMMSSPNGAFWFLKALLISSLLYAFVSFSLRKFMRFEIYIQTIVAIVLLIAGVIMPPFGLWHYLGGRVVFTAYALFHLGRLLKILACRLSTRNIYLFSTLGLILLLFMLKFERFEIAINRFHSIPVFLLASISGWFFLSGLYKLCELINIHKYMCYVGVRTMPILIFHFLAFKIVSAIGVLLLGHPAFCIAAFPVYFHGPIWCMLYTLVGILVPIMMFEAYTTTKSVISQKVNWKWLVR